MWCRVLVAISAYVFSVARAQSSWDDVRKVLQKGVDDRVYPGAVALVGNEDGVLFQAAVGTLTYGQKTPTGGANEAMTVSGTRFDMASCTKVLSTTSAVALLFQKGAFGQMGLETKVGSLLDGFGVNGKETITIENCLLHNTGFPPDPTPNFWEPTFGCAGAPLPSSMNFDCSEKAFQAIKTQALRPGATVGGKFVYSDLSFLTLMHVVGHVAFTNKYVTVADFLPQCSRTIPMGPGLQNQCAYEAFVRTHIFSKLGMKNTQFLPPKSDWPSCAPTTIPTGEPKEVEGVALQGRVEDGNAYMLGGIAGHAGLFSNVDDISSLLNELLFRNYIFNQTTVRTFTKQHNHSQSSRAYGWDTNDITAIPDGNYGGCCGALSAKTFTHTGYTGTQVCADPEKRIYTILLTARVYNMSNTGNSKGILSVRRSFGNAVAAVVDAKLLHK
jgi:CubicO group peptidase (beta-lactamase class C family)